LFSIVLDVLGVFQKTHEELMNPMDIHRRNAGQRRRQSAKHTNKRANGIGKTCKQRHQVQNNTKPSITADTGANNILR
jgi:hypothetical protein